MPTHDHPYAGPGSAKMAAGPHRHAQAPFGPGQGGGHSHSRVGHPGGLTLPPPGPGSPYGGGLTHGAVPPGGNVTRTTHSHGIRRM